MSYFYSMGNGHIYFAASASGTLVIVLGLVCGLYYFQCFLFPC